MCLPSLHCNEEPECFQGFEWGATWLCGWKEETAVPAGWTWDLWTQAAGDRARLAVPVVAQGLPMTIYPLFFYSSIVRTHGNWVFCCTLYLYMQFSWSMVTSIFWCLWCAYRIHFPCVCPIWRPCGHQSGRRQPWDVGGTMKDHEVAAEPMLGWLCSTQDHVFVICTMTVPCSTPDVRMPCFLIWFLSHLSPDVDLQFSLKMFKKDNLLCKATESCLQSLPPLGFLLTSFKQLKFKWETNWSGTGVGEDQGSTGPW